MSASRAFTARFDSECAVCDGLIEGDVDTIVMEDGKAMHQECAAPDRQSRLTTIRKKGSRDPDEVAHPGNPAQAFFE